MAKKYGSDLVVDLLRQMDIEYVAMNPGESTSGLHDSLVNYGGNKAPEIILCLHENLAVFVAQGYAKAAGKPMAALVTGLVGVLDAELSVFLDWLDQAPVLLISGAGPLAVEERRPGADWHHTALLQNTLVRDFVKWDDQPTSIEGMSEAFYRAYRAAMTEPRGPAYISLDSGLQMQETPADYAIPEFSRYPVPSQPQADPAALQRLARALVKAERPVIIADYLGRNPGAVRSLVELAELLAIPVIDTGSRFNMPNTHPLDLSGCGRGLTSSDRELIAAADVVLGLDVHDFYNYLAMKDKATRTSKMGTAAGAEIFHISVQELAMRGWSPHVGKLTPMESIIGDTSLALPTLIKLARREIARQDPIDRQKRFKMLKEKHDAARKEWRQSPESKSGEKPIALSFLARELGKAVAKEDWVLGSRTLGGWTRRLWDWTSPYQWVGAYGGGGLTTALGNAIGTALAHKGTDRIVIDVQPDGDFLYHPSGLWTAAHYRLPMLIVMLDNRSYYAIEDHQEGTAKQRGRPVANKGIGTHISDPEIDYAALAKAFGIHSEGPIEEPEEVLPALKRAVRHIKEKRTCALVDVVTQPR